jgi:hypothetical protein
MASLDSKDYNDNGESLVDHDAYHDTYNDMFDMVSDDGDDVVGGIRLSRHTRTPKFVNSLPPYQSFQLRVWRMINGPLEEGDRKGRMVNLLFQVNAIAFIVLVILETEKHIYEHHLRAFDVTTRVLASIITIEYVLCLWSVTANAEYSGKNGRFRWATSSLALVDLIVIGCYWTSEVLHRQGANPLDEKIIKSFQTLRLLRLLRMFEVVESARVKRAFRLLCKLLSSLFGYGDQCLLYMSFGCCF